MECKVLREDQSNSPVCFGLRFEIRPIVVVTHLSYFDFEISSQGTMFNISPNSSFVRDTAGITTDRLKTLLNQTSQRQAINNDKQITQKRILFSVLFLGLVQMIVYVID